MCAAGVLHHAPAPAKHKGPGARAARRPVVMTPNGTLPILERKLYDSALRLLVDEISFSLERGKEDVEELVFARLNAKN